MINVSQALGPVFQEIIVAGVDFKSSSGGTVALEGNSNNDGRMDPVNGRTGKDEPIEQAGVPATPGQNQQTPTPLAQPAAPTGPGLIIPVGGTRAEMRVAFQTGRKPTLTITEDGDKIRVFDPTGKEVLNARSDSIEVCGDSPQTFTIAAIAPSASLADIVITLTGDSSGPPARDIVRATAVPVDLDGTANYAITGLTADPPRGRLVVLVQADFNRVGRYAAGDPAASQAPEGLWSFTPADRTWARLEPGGVEQLVNGGDHLLYKRGDVLHRWGHARESGGVNRGLDVVR